MGYYNMEAGDAPTFNYLARHYAMSDNYHQSVMGGTGANPFFGDGERVPMVVVSPYAKPGYISHTYTDHVSILKFIERNWRLSTLSNRSLDKLPNPVASGSDPYVPTNRPAIGDLFDLFEFHQPHLSTPAPPQRGGRRTSGKVTHVTNALR